MAILFDLDGTLLDTAPDFLEALNILRQEEGLSHVKLDCIRNAVSNGIEGLIKAGFEDIFKNLEDSSKDSPSQIKELNLRMLALYQKNPCCHTKFFPGIPELLSFLEQKKIPWGIVTNKTTDLTNPIIHKLGLKERAASIVCGDTTANAKPHPEPILYACKEINVNPSNCVYIGDAERDIQAGQAAGLITIGALFGYIPDVTEATALWNADHYVHHPDEILPILLKCLPSLKL